MKCQVRSIVGPQLLTITAAFGQNSKVTNQLDISNVCLEDRAIGMLDLEGYGDSPVQVLKMPS